MLSCYAERFSCDSDIDHTVHITSNASFIKSCQSRGQNIRRMHGTTEQLLYRAKCISLYISHWVQSLLQHAKGKKTCLNPQQFIFSTHFSSRRSNFPFCAVQEHAVLCCAVLY